MASRFDLVIFDCDGVLVNTEPMSDLVVSQALAEVGLRIAPREINRLTRGVLEADAWAILARELGSPIPASALARVNQLGDEALLGVEAIKGVDDVLALLVALQVPVCVASSGSQEKMDVTLRVTNLARYFNGRIFSATQVSNGKPAPDLFLFAAAQMGAAPGRTAVIEDSLNGCKAGVAAGMTTFGYLPPDYRDERIADLPIQTFGAMRELPALLGLEAVP